MSSEAGDRADPPATGAADASESRSAAEAGAVTSAGAAPDGFGTRGWVLVGAVALSTAVVPGLIYAFPALPADAGLPFLVAMLVLPLLPAVLLGAAAVWSMAAATGPTDDRD
ncbi:MAG: hypothetical protein ABEH78_00425 [Haloferacaceae archaeon]